MALEELVGQEYPSISGKRYTIVEIHPEYIRKKLSGVSFRDRLMLYAIDEEGNKVILKEPSKIGCEYEIMDYLVSSGLNDEDIILPIETIPVGRKAMMVYPFYSVPQELLSEEYKDDKLFNSVNLAQFLILKRESKQYLSEDDIFSLAYWMIKTLNKLHENNMIFIDWKPSNIVITYMQEDQLKICDFESISICKRDKNGFLRHNDLFPILGTPAYSAPEAVLFDKSTSDRSDVYSWAVNVVRMYHGMVKRDMNSEIIRINKRDREDERKEYLSSAQKCKELGFLIPDDIDNDELIPEYMKGVLRPCLDINPNKRPNSFEVKYYMYKKGIKIRQRYNRMITIANLYQSMQPLRAMINL